MDNRKFVLGEIGQWAREGAIDEATRARLAARYAADAGASSLRAVVCLSIGALLVGLGVIALLAANWDALSRNVRAVISVLPLALCVAAWLAGVAKGWRGRGFFEPLGIFWSLAVGTGISLVAQTYQISGDPAAFTLTWTLLLLPTLYATRALGPGLGYFIGLFVWVCIRTDAEANTQLYWLLAPLAVPALARIRRESPGGVRFGLVLWGAALCSTAALGFTLVKAMPGLWMIVYSGAFAALLLGGLLCEAGGRSIWQTPMRTLGGGGLAVLLFLLIFRWPWHEIGYDHYRANYETRGEMWFDYTLVAVLPLLAVALACRVWLKRARGERLVPTLWGLAPVVVAAGYMLAMKETGEPWAAALLCTGYLAAMGLATMAAGFARRSLMLVNSGVLVLLAVIVGKFFADEHSFTVRGVAFVVCGSLFFVANWIASRRLKQASGQEVG
ncbi:MAG: DUF2157 domain-containing protein [Verrucomicrobiota bacterium]|jgi:uncharacterized membrane protein|nr:DUF2157 domain-containing protein [Verrucomicrobiota bacterium]